MIRIFFALMLLLSILPAYALEYQEGGNETTRTIEDYIEDYIDIPTGAIDWKILGKTKEIKVAGKDSEGYDYEYSKPDFPDEVKSLDGKEITIKGFMFPLEAADDQKLFLLGPFPISCPFHYHVGPALILEVHMAKGAVPFDFEPIILKGTLKLVPADPENNVFYRLESAKLL